MSTEPLMNEQMSLFAETVAPRVNEIDAIIARARQARSEVFARHARAAGRFVAELFRPLAEAVARDRAYRELMALDDRVLADMGITRDQIPSVVAGHLVRDPVSSKPMDRVLKTRPVTLQVVQSPAAPIERRAA